MPPAPADKPEAETKDEAKTEAKKEAEGEAKGDVGMHADKAESKDVEKEGKATNPEGKGNDKADDVGKDTDMPDVKVTPTCTLSIHVRCSRN